MLSYCSNWVKRLCWRSVSFEDEYGRILDLLLASLQKLIVCLLVMSGKWMALSGLLLLMDGYALVSSIINIVRILEFWKSKLFIISKSTMFDEEDYVSDEEEPHIHSTRNTGASQALVSSSGSNCNQLYGQGESLMKMMKDRGLDLTENEMKKMKEQKGKEKPEHKPKSKTGFFDGGDKASVEQLIRALNKAFSQADPQQASCILSCILEKKNLSSEDRNKFSIMKCNILFGLGAYDECLNKAQEFLLAPYNNLSAAIFSNLMAKAKSQTDKLLSGYMDYLRAQSLLDEYKEQLAEDVRRRESQQLPRGAVVELSQEAVKKEDDYSESQLDTTTKQITHTQMEYNIKMSKYKNCTNLVYPYFNELRHRKIYKVVCGDFHTLFLVGGAIDSREQRGSTVATQVFGLGENTVGQVTGRSRKVIFKEPVLVAQLSNKHIQGIWASRESSLAYDAKGNVYEWGVKENRNELIEVSYVLGEGVVRLEKGYRHFAALSKSGKFYSWGVMEMQGVPVYSQPKPQVQDCKNIVSFSCGNSHTVAVDGDGNAYGIGSNEMFQLGLPSDRLCKNFKKVQSNMIGKVKKVFVITDCTFLVNEDNEVFFCGRYSLKREPQCKFRQAEFGDTFNDLVLMSGSLGTYYATNESGSCYKWDVDTMVKFKLDQQPGQPSQRYVQGCRGAVLRVKSLLAPELCRAVRVTKQLRTYQPISYLITMEDEFGLYGVPDFIIPPKFQIFLSTYKVKSQELFRQNRLFLQSHIFGGPSTKMFINEIVENRLLEYEIERDQIQPWKVHLKVLVEMSGRYYFYILLEESLVIEEELLVQISEREKQLQAKNKQQRLFKEEQRRKKTERERERLAEEKLRKQQEEEEKKKQTQRRAEETLKRHLREQEEAKLKEEQQRKARKQLLTGGGFDLSKMRKTTSTGQGSQPTVTKTDKLDRTEKLEKTGESFLPDISLRPSSRKRVTLPKPSELIGPIADSNKEKPTPILKVSATDFSSTGFSAKDKEQSNPTTTKERGSTPKQAPTVQPSVLQTNTGLKPIKVGQQKLGIVKRGVSNKKK